MQVKIQQILLFLWATLFNCGAYGAQHVQAAQGLALSQGGYQAILGSSNSGGGAGNITQAMLVSDDEIDCFGRHLSQRYPHFRLLSCALGDFDLADSAPEQFAEALGEVFADSSITQFAIPQHTGIGHHWVMWFIDKTLKTVEIFDSKGMSMKDRNEPNGPRRDRYLNRQQVLLAHLGEGAEFHDVFARRQVREAVEFLADDGTEPLQENDHFCGVHIMHYAHCALVHKRQASQRAHFFRSEGSREDWTKAMSAYRHMMRKVVYPRLADPICEHERAYRELTQSGDSNTSTSMIFDELMDLTRSLPTPPTSPIDKSLSTLIIGASIFLGVGILGGVALRLSNPLFSPKKPRLVDG